MFKKVHLQFIFTLSLWISVCSVHAVPNVGDEYVVELYAQGVGAVTGLAMDSNGVLYATDFAGGRVLQIPSQNTINVMATGIPFITDLAFTEEGRLFVTSSTGSNSSVVEVFNDGTFSNYVTGFSFPTSIESLGNELFVTNSGDGTISRIDAMQNVTTFLSGFSTPGGPFGISFDPSNTYLFFIDHQTGNVYRADLNGNTQILATVTSLGGTFTSVGFDEKLFVSDTNQAALYALDAQNNFSVFASNFEGKSSPPVIGPNDSIFDGENSLFVGDGNFIWKISRSQIRVTIDIDPRKQVNKINPISNRPIKVAILTEGEFDALQVDPATVQFGPAAAPPIPFVMQAIDVDQDGDADLVLTFRVRQTGIVCGDTEATLTGETFDGRQIIGTDSIVTLGCK